VRRAALALALLLAVAPTRARAEEPTSEAIERPEADFRHFSDYAWFALGAAAGFVGHELGHMMMDVFFGKTVSFVKVELGPIPFFAIQPCCNLTPRENYVIGSAGFVVGDVSSELILQIAPKLRSQRHAFLKGVLMFDILLSTGYAITGFAGIGPPQSDVNTMARGLNVPPWQVGVMLIVPAAVDLYRYFVPRSAWAPWTSIAGKTFLVGVGFTF
jgi:hypothetical protein